MELALTMAMCFMFVICIAAVACAFFLPQKIISGIRGLLMPGAVQDESIREQLLKMGVLKDKGEVVEEIPDFAHPSPLRGLNVPFVDPELEAERAEEENEIFAELEAAESIRIKEEYPVSDSQEYAEFLDKTTEIK